MKKEFRAAITKGNDWIEAGRTGKATYPVNKYGNVMFYPIDGKAPYCICLREGDIEWKET